MAYPPRVEIRAEAAAEIDAWATPCTVKRFVSTTDASGRKVGSYVTQTTTEKLWIQPAGGFADTKDFGIGAETTHLAFQNYSGYVLEAKDRIVPSGQTYEYDVLRALVYESHRLAELRQVPRV
jgi:hypothetical protein